MPGASKRTRATSRRRTSKAAAPQRPAALTDATADIGDLFEEILLETLTANDALGWKAGPVVAISMSRLSAGHLAWTAALSAPGSSPVGQLHLIVVPGSGRQAPKEIPLLDARWNEFDSVDHFVGPPRLLLLSQARAPTLRAGVRQLTHDLFTRLAGELTPGRSGRRS